ncbi:hypothetical protein O0L34_g5352 [Tuta absoluta]|nr:hypothetical protein O0L34_g5352 [Tuta absoluta]
MEDYDPEEQLKSRQYQTELEEIAMAKNTIIHLPTGSGKTFIAIRIIQRNRHDLKAPWGCGGKRTFFLVNTIPLVTQQKKVIQKMCAVKSVAGYSGEDGVDYWDKNKWDAELSEHEVIVMTSQILADMLTHSYIRIHDINLLIFDECHHAVVDHPMRLVMKHFEGVPVEKQPRVLGLTATLLNANVNINRVEESLRELETTFHATIATVNELGEVLSYSTNPNECVKLYRSSPPTPAAREAISILQELQMIVMKVTLPAMTGDPNIKLERGQRDISTDPKKIVKEVRKMLLSLVMFIEELGAYGGQLSCIAYSILLERLKRKAITTEEEHLYKIAVTHITMARMILLRSMNGDEGYERIVRHSSEKVLLLLNILKEFNPEYYNKPLAHLRVNQAKQPLSGIIFTKQRFTAKIIYNLLKDVKDANPKEFGFLKHDFIVGFNINPYKATREQFYTKKSSQTALLKFSNKELNCLISTSVIEEGVDIPQCMLVLRYDPPLEYRSYIQSKGRARSSDSTFVLLVNESDRDKFMKQFQSFQITEHYIQKVLVGNTEDRDAPTQENIEDSLYNEDEIPPYVTKHGARLSSVQAISLLNRYCSVLPHDQFTTINPMWVEEKIDDPKKGRLRVIKIYMPIACPVKDLISGEPKAQLKTAKRSAALNACITLHKAGELDYLTLLPKNYGTVDFEQPELMSCFPNWPTDEKKCDSDKKPGTKKRVRKYKKVFSQYLKGLPMSEPRKFYLHVIALDARYPEPSDSRPRALYRLLQERKGFGLLTMQALPRICEFPICVAEGEVNTKLLMNYAAIELNDKTFELVKRFHWFIFDQVLAIKKKFTVFDGLDYALYAVPVTSTANVTGTLDHDIDWEVMQTHTEIRPVVEPSFEERRTLRVTEESHRYRVVSPWYRGIILPSRYIVSNVLEYMTPQSQFAPNSETSYADYYSNKYNLEIMGDKNQPLLEVQRLTSRGFNCLLPASSTIKAFSEKQMKMIALALGEDKLKGFPEVFVPEFCICYDFPSALWYKAGMLPSIMHRVTMLLVAYELRAEIARQTKIGVVHLPAGQEWKPIEVNVEVAVQSLLSFVEPDETHSNNIDRINNPIDEDAPRPMNIVSMKESLYQLQKKKISEEYNWDEKTEPLDIERNISSVTVMDVECYDEFVSTPMSVAPDATSPYRSPSRKLAAILPPPVQKLVKIEILEKKVSARGPELRDILAAITTINSHDAFNLERAETLGDSFLKFAASLYLHHKFPSMNEGQLTNIKGRLIGNRNLFYAGTKVQLGGRMKVEQFTPATDYLTPGFFAPRQVQKMIEDKQVS